MCRGAEVQRQKGEPHAEAQRYRPADVPRGLREVLRHRHELRAGDREDLEVRHRTGAVLGQLQ